MASSGAGAGFTTPFPVTSLDSVPATEHRAKFKEDKAIILGFLERQPNHLATSTGGSHGYLSSVLSTPDWQNLDGILLAPEIIADPHADPPIIGQPARYKSKLVAVYPDPPAANATSTALAIYNIRTTLAKDTDTVLCVTTHLLTSYIGKLNADSMGVTAMTSAEELWAAMMRKFGVYTEAEIEKLERDLSAPISTPFSEHLTTTINAHIKLDSAKQPLSEASKLRAYANAIASHPGAAGACRRYNENNPDLATRTFAGLAAYLRIQEANILASPGTADVGYTGAIASAATAQQAPRGSRKYCWWHGYGRHLGIDCTCMETDETKYRDARKAIGPDRVFIGGHGGSQRAHGDGRGDGRRGGRG
jgi:hypothetical protein